MSFRHASECPTTVREDLSDGELGFGTFAH